MLETKNTQLLQNPTTTTTSSSAALLAFKPRQVLLLSKSLPFPAMAKNQQQLDEVTTLKQKTLLQQSILNYLHLNGFSKTLKRFLKETHTQGDSWKSSSHNLEEVYYKYLNNCSDNYTNSKVNSEPEQCEDGTNRKSTSKNASDTQETNSKKKKKKRSEDKNSDVPDASHTEGVDKSTENAVSAQEVLADEKVDVSLKKQKEKKKKKTEEKSEDAVPVGNDNIGETTKKDKKKKSKEENGATTDSKDSKKRKRVVSDANANQGVEEVRTEESKRRKTGGLEESKDAAEHGKSDALCTNNGHAESGNEERNGEVRVGELNDSAKQKSSKKERNGSAEPKTVNAFQRVKIDQVEFTDDRLKDNSYWAKDGAEIGYGAKAQEVLGQVKGRDFRHEKTKKKRGSYRGGQIDLQSHSIKFNYSDEE